MTTEAIKPSNSNASPLRSHDFVSVIMSVNTRMAACNPERNLHVYQPIYKAVSEVANCIVQSSLRAYSYKLQYIPTPVT